MGFTTATDIHQQQGDKIFLSTGSSELDKLMQGDISSAMICSLLRLIHSLSFPASSQVA